MAKILDGRLLAGKIRNKIKERVQTLSSPPTLAVILVGNDPASHLYVAIKKKACEEAGIRFEQFLYSENESEETLIKKIHELNKRADVSGILVQLPLPKQNADPVIAAMDPHKDVDGFHRSNIERLKRGEPALAPAVALGIMKLIDSTGQKITRAALISSELFAEPLVALLKEHGARADVLSTEDPELKTKTKTADLLIVAVGKPGFVSGSMVKPGAIVIDVGTTKKGEKLLGDVDRPSVESVARFLSPVPGGVGPMTVAMLLSNVYKAQVGMGR